MIIVTITNIITIITTIITIIITIILIVVIFLSIDRYQIKLIHKKRYTLCLKHACSVTLWHLDESLHQQSGENYLEVTALARLQPKTKTPQIVPHHIVETSYLRHNRVPSV